MTLFEQTGWTSWYPEVLSNLNHSVILWYEYTLLVFRHFRMGKIHILTTSADSGGNPTLHSYFIFVFVCPSGEMEVENSLIFTSGFFLRRTLYLYTLYLLICFFHWSKAIQAYNFIFCQEIKKIMHSQQGVSLEVIFLLKSTKW